MQIQQLLVLMESDTIKESIDNLIKARPCVSVADDTGSLTKSYENTLFNTGNRHSSMKRKSVALPLAKCNCGKCSKCVPSPSGKTVPSIGVAFTFGSVGIDWVWNGRKFVQVSKEWKMSDSSGSIQSALCSLIETVEAATRKVVDQRKQINVVSTIIE